MASRITVIHGAPAEAGADAPGVEDSDLLLSWHGERANVAADLQPVCGLGRNPVSDPGQDLLDIAVGLYAADIAVKRGEREEWPREIELALPVRDLQLWEGLRGELQRIVYELSRDTFRIEFYQAETAPARAPAGDALRQVEPDCVSMLSGGLDSLAGAVMLQETGRTPVYVLHRSGNPAVRTAQERALAAIRGRWPNRSMARPCSVEPHPRGEDALPFPAAEAREPSRRCRSVLFMALALVAADTEGLSEVHMPENGVLTAGLPISSARVGSMSTHSTHPAALALMNRIAKGIGLAGRLINPFVYQTKGELIRDILAPNLSVDEIQSTVSCWAVGRANRQCGGCIPCLLRQVGMAWAELPPEAYMVDVLSRPEDYVGTDAYGNLVDLLRQAEQISRLNEAEMLTARPELLSLHAAGLDVDEVVGMLKRHAEQTLTVVRRRYPAAGRLIF
jgi:7-cyano-7-deazaguanine synthase in queuosine biosynthesis